MTKKKIWIFAVLLIAALFLGKSIKFTENSSEMRVRGWSLTSLARALQAYRSKLHVDAKSFRELGEFDSDPSSAEWFGQWKELILWPNWSFRYCGTRPATWNVAQIKGDEIGPYKFIADPNSKNGKYIIMEKPNIPLLDGFRYGIRRSDLEVEPIW